MSFKAFGATVSAIAAVLLLGSCVEQPRKMTTQEKEAIKPFILTSKPVIGHPLDVNLENHVLLLGYDVKPDRPIKPGQNFTITFY